MSKTKGGSAAPLDDPKQMRLRRHFSIELGELDPPSDNSTLQLPNGP
jgi:hypothetical protein